MKLYVYGASGHGREIAQLAKRCGYAVSAFIDDNSSLWSTHINDIPVVSASDALDYHDTQQFIVAIGNPEARRTIMERLQRYGFKFATLIHPNVDLDDHVTVGEGSMICAGCSIKVNASIGRGVILNSLSTVGHDSILEDYVSVMPGVNISGGVHVCTGAYIGTNAAIRNGVPDKMLIVGAHAVVGMGAIVVKAVGDNTTVVGNPAKERT